MSQRVTLFFFHLTRSWMAQLAGYYIQNLDEEFLHLATKPGGTWHEKPRGSFIPLLHAKLVAGAAGAIYLSFL